MYYSSDQISQSFFGSAEEVRGRRKSRLTAGWWLGGGLVGLFFILGAIGWRGTPRYQQPNHPLTLGVASTSATFTNSVTFGDLLKEHPSYAGWLAGVNQGTIVLADPQSGQTLPIISVPNQWYGPVSPPVWSPDRLHLAYLTLPVEDAGGLARDQVGYAKKLGLTSVPTPETFPYGRVTIVDILSKQAHQTTVEVRNTAQNLVWLDNDSVATIGQTVIKYTLSTDQSTPLAAGGNTQAHEQLQSPLAWDSTHQVLYFTKVRQDDSGTATRLVESLSISTNQVTEMQPLTSGAFADVTANQGIGLALSFDGSRLAESGDQGLSYVTISDGGTHGLPYSDDWLWLKQTTISNLEWLSPDKLSFVSQDGDGVKVWGVWDIPQSQIYTFGRGALAGSWDLASQRLASVAADGQSLSIITPKWTDPTQSGLETLHLAWTDLSW